MAAITEYWKGPGKSLTQKEANTVTCILSKLKFDGTIDQKRYGQIYNYTWRCTREQTTKQQEDPEFTAKMKAAHNNPDNYFKKSDSQKRAAKARRERPEVKAARERADEKKKVWRAATRG